MVQTAAVAVVGASSYYAGPILSALKKAGYRTVGVVRQSSKTEGIQDVDHIARGDMTDINFMKEATSGCCSIIDLVCQQVPPCDTIEEQLTNDVAVLDACLFAGLAHDAQVVFTSGNFSLPTKGRSPVISPALVPLPPEQVGSGFSAHLHSYEHAYPTDSCRAVVGETKHRMELYVDMFVKLHPRSKACVIIPCATYGLGQAGRTSFWDKAVGWYLAGQWQDFPTNWIHIEDLARVFVALVQKGRPGGRYLAAGEPMLVSHFFEMYCRLAGREVPAGLPTYQGPRLAYDDSATLQQLGLQYQHSVASSLGGTIEQLRSSGRLDPSLMIQGGGGEGVKQG